LCMLSRSEIARAGGIARAKKLSRKRIHKICVDAARASWAGKTAEERSARILAVWRVRRERAAA
jgi:hypothetical protein